MAECFWDCKKLLSLLLDSSLVLSLCPLFGDREFLLGAFMMLPHIKWPSVCSYLALGHLNESLCFAFKPSLLGFSVGQCIHQGGDYEHIVEICPCVCDEWLTHVWKVWRFSGWVIFHMCLIMLMANQRCCVELCCIKCIVQHVSWLVVRRCGARRRWSTARWRSSRDVPCQ